MNKTCRRLAFIFSAALLSLTCLTAAAEKSATPPRVLMETSMGSIVLELYPEKAPKTVANFLRYVKEGHYTGTIFHRVINGFMIQGGGFDTKMRQKPTHAPIENEAKNGLSNAPYTIAMARTSAPHSASAQFFINVKQNRFLDYPGQDGWGYAVFGKVVKGAQVVDEIKQVQTGHMDIPVKQVIIKSVTLMK